MRNRRLFRLLAILFAFTLVAAACGDDDDSTSSSGESSASSSSSESSSAEGLNIGTLLPETGPLAFLSAPMLEGVNMAIADINAAGGVNGAPVTLSPGDSGTDAEIANATVDRLITENVDAIIGAASSGTTGSVIEKITKTNGITQCSPSNTAAGLGVSTESDDGNYFRTAPSDDLQAPLLANVVLGDGYTNVAVVSRADDYGVGFNAVLIPAIEAGGGEVVYDTPYAPEATSFDDVVQDVVASGPDAVVLVAFEEGFQIIQAMIEQGAGPDAIQIYITDGMATGELGAAIDPDNPGIAEGMKGTAPAAAPESGAAFFPAAFEEYAPGVPSIYSSQSYDCAILIALAAEAAGSNDSADISAAMVDVSRDGEKCSTFADCKDLLAGGTNIDYDGASGAIDFLDAGEPGAGIYDIYDFDENGVQRVLEQQTFTDGSAPVQAAPAPAGIGLNALDTPTTMSTTCAPSIASLPQWIAVAEGLYEARNLTLECVQIGSGPETAAALASGEADFAANIYNNVFPLLNNGLEVVVFMETLLYNLFDVIVDADYAAANDITADMDWEEAMQKLDCTNVGVVARNAAAEDLARILINAAGLDESCFTYVAVGIQPLPALESNDTDWTVTFDPFQVVAVNTGAGINPFSIQRGEGPPGLDWPGLVYMTGVGNFEAKQAELCAYKSGTVEAINWLADPANAERAGEIAATRLAEALHPLIPALIAKYQNAFSTTGDIQFGQIETISQISVDVGKTDRLFAADEVAQDLSCD